MAKEKSNDSPTGNNFIFVEKLAHLIGSEYFIQ